MINQIEVAFAELVALYTEMIINSENDLFSPPQSIEPEVLENPISQVDAIFLESDDLISDADIVYMESYQDAIATHNQILQDSMILLVADSEGFALPELDFLIGDQTDRLEDSIHTLVSYRDLFGYVVDDEKKAFALDGYLEFGKTAPSQAAISEATFVMLDDLLFTDRSRFLQDNFSNRDHQIAAHCRTILIEASQDSNPDDLLFSFKRSDFQGEYIFTHDRYSDTSFLQFNSHSDVLPHDLIFVESKGKILYSKVTDINADQVHQSVLSLNPKLEHEKETLTR